MRMNDIKFDFKNKIAVVVGGSKGIGLEVVNQFISAGATTFCVSRTNPKIKGCYFIKCDISDENSINESFKSLKDIDFLINVAGTNLCRPIEDINSSEWDRVLNTNLKSFYLISKKVINIMKSNNFGRIVNVSSIAGRNKSIVSGVHYTSSKYGIIGLTKQLSNEVSKYNILVNCTCPSQTMTEMLRESMTKDQIKELSDKIPVRRVATVEEQAAPILFLCSSAASYIAGAAIDINGGQL
jgi:3-oxoacyl-[acyl-carrier protein] reductase